MKKKVRELKPIDLLKFCSYDTSMVDSRCKIKSPYPDCCIGCPMNIDGKSLCRQIVAILDSEVEVEDGEDIEYGRNI